MQREFDAIEELLMRWADFMRNPGDAGLGYPAKASGGFISSWRKDSDEEMENADAYEIGKINASIESLVMAYQRIIFKHHRIGYLVWRFPNEDALYLAAKAAFAVRHNSAEKTLAYI